MRKGSLLIIAGFMASLSIPGSALAQETADTYCVRVSEPVQAKNVNKLVVRERVTVSVVPNSACSVAPLGPRASFVVFADHVARLETGRLIKEFEGAIIGQDDLDSLVARADGLIAYLDSELDWLAAFEPDPCYAELLDTHVSVAEESRRAAGLMRDALDEVDVAAALRVALMMHIAKFEAGVDAGATSGEIPVDISGDLESYVAACQ